MPHLDANALTDDLQGLEFLADVLEVPVDHALPRWEMPTPVTVVPETIIVRAVTRRRRKRVALVPEAA